jgi:hypothetical protein
MSSINNWVSPIRREDKIKLFNPFLKYYQKVNKFYKPKITEKSKPKTLF